MSENFEAIALQEHAALKRYREALDGIWKIVHTPTRDTRHRTAEDHFQADFDSIRKIIAGVSHPVGNAPPCGERTPLDPGAASQPTDSAGNRTGGSK